MRLTLHFDRLICPLLLFPFISALGCRPKNTDSTVRHVAGQVALSGHASNWIATSPAEFKAAIEREMKETPVLTHPIRDRLQIWTDAMDQQARRTAWGQQNMRNTPKPYVVILNTDEINAFASGLEVVYSAAATHTGSPGKTAQSGKCLMIDDWGAQLKYDDSGLTLSGDKTLLPEIIQRLRKNLDLQGKSCKPVLKGTAIVETENCTNQQYSNFRAPAFCVNQTSNAIVVFSGLIKSFSEEQVIAVVAHELGHYYKAHASDFNSLNSESFYFWEKDAGRPERPARISDSGLTLQISQVRDRARTMRRFQKATPDTHYPPYLLARLLPKRVEKWELENSSLDEKIWKKNVDQQGAVSLAKLFTEQCRMAHGNLQDCDKFESNVAAWGEEINYFVVNWTPEEKQYFANIDDAFSRFSGKLFLKFAGGQSQKSADLPMRFITGGIVDPVYENIVKVTDTIEKRTDTRVSVDEFFKAVEKSLADDRMKIESDFENIRSRGIGWYTVEQEADEIAGELLSGIGIDPQMASTMLMSLADLHPKSWNRSALSSDACKKMLGTRFGFGTSTITPVPLQDWFDPHHDSCYRIFNIERDLFTHQYKVETQNLPKFGQPWNEIVKSMPDSPKPKPTFVATPDPVRKSPTSAGTTSNTVRRAAARLRIVPAHY